MEQFEYMTTCINIFNDEMNKFGKEGWELIQVFQKDNNYFGVFKRRI